jgi:hypothetical protein
VGWKRILLEGDPVTGTVTVADITKTVTPISGATTAGGNTIVRTPASGMSVRLKDIFIWNCSAADRWVGLRFGWTGSLHFPALLASKTGFAKNIVGGNIQGAVDETLYLYASGDLVYFTVLAEDV